MPKSPYSPEYRVQIAKEYLAGKGSMESIARKYQINATTVLSWVKCYKEHGISAFISATGNRAYTAEFKKMCVELYIYGDMSLRDISIKYNISSIEVLRGWIKKYNANRELTDYIPRREVYMAEAGRKTTIEERKEIVRYCLEHGKDYRTCAVLFDVSYNQVYSWVKKFETKGEDGLIDKRGIHKTDDELSEIELLRRENKRLLRQLEEERMYNELLKKLKEFEGV